MINPTKKLIQKRRIMGYFIEAATQIIDEEGIEGITTRKVADIAGYNISTMYNYFENLDHLIFFALLKHLKDYLLHLKDYIKDAKNAQERYFLIWELFCSQSFKQPWVYDTLFFRQFSTPYNHMMPEYYSLFPEEMADFGNELHPMLLNPNLSQRNMVLLKNCSMEGFLKEEVLEELNEMTLLIYQSMLQRILNKQVEYTSEEATSRTINYIKKCFKAYNDCTPLKID